MTDNINKKEQYLWVEKYRPKKVSECILPSDIKNIFQQYVDKGTIPNLLFVGGPGIGKTTIAKALCLEIGCEYMFINGSDERGIDVLRTKIKSYASTMSLVENKRKVIIVDEADYLTPECQAAFRGAIEEFSNNCSFVFTCNYKSKLIQPLADSRFAIIEFKIKNDEKPVLALEFMKRTRMILEQENIEYDPKVVAEIVKKYFPDFRRILSELQKYSISGKIDIGLLSKITDIGLKDLMGFIKNKDFTSMRKWVGTNVDYEPSRLFRRIYDSLYEYFEPESIPQAVVTLGEYQYKNSFVADQEINTVACFVELMINCRFK